MPKDIKKFTMEPAFLEQLSRMDPEVRDQIMEGLEDFKRRMRRNPWLGTPMFGGPPMRAYVWMRRNLRRFTNWVGDRIHGEPLTEERARRIHGGRT